MANAASTFNLAASAAAAEPTADPTEGATILVVDDDAMNRFLMQESLAMDAHRIVEAGSGEEALAIVTARMPDLILLDIDMPGMNGLAACRAIRALPAGRMTPIMMVTGLDNAASVDAAFECGATDFLAKPLNWTLMRQRVRFILRHGAVVRRLYRNEQILEQVHDVAKIGHWEWDLRAGVISTSPQMRRMFPQTRPVAGGIWLNYKPRSRHAELVVTETRLAVERGQHSFTAEDMVEVPGAGMIRLLSHGQIEYEDGVAVRAIGSLQDVTQRYLNEERYTAVFNDSPVGIIEIDYSPLLPLVEALRTGTINPDDASLREHARAIFPQPSTNVLRVNTAAQRLLGALPIGDPRLVQLGTDCLVALVKAVHDGDREVELHGELALPEDTRHLVIRLPVPRTPEEYKRVVISTVDVTELIRRELRLRHADKIIENSNDAIVLISRDKQIYSINPAFTRITGYTEQHVCGKGFARMLARTQALPDPLEMIRRSMDQHSSWRGEAEFICRDGEVAPMLVNISTIYDDANQTSGYVVVMTDIAHLKESERRLFQLAHFDALTALPNRLALQERLQHEISAAQHHPVIFSLLYIDLDGFKLVNDSMGHTVGDTLLADVARRLKAASRPDDLLARIGGDEFALLMSAAPDRQQIKAQAERLLTALDTPFTMQGREIFIGASIGACTYPDEAANADEMLRNADTAMYQAKRLGRGQLCFYSNALTQESSRRLGIENELRTAISGDQLFLVYQPKYDATNSARMVGAEALVRWRSPTRGVVPPNDFIGIAEESGLIIALGEWVINEACRQIAAWRSEVDFALPVAINISALHLRQRSLLQVVGDAIARFDIDPKLLEIEITEDSLDFRGNEDDDPYEILNRLSAMGLSIAIDDFGTGYSSLSQLKKMPISTLKIDRSFVHDIAVDESDYAIITAIVGLAKTLGMQIVAEGVENEEQAAQLRTLKCDVFQGFLYSRPLDPEDFMRRFIEQAPPAP